MQVSTGDLALVLGITERRVQQLENGGVFRRLGHGEWDLAEAVQAYVQHRLKAKRRVTAAGGKAEEKLKAAKAGREELKLAVEAGNLIAADEAIEILDEIVGAVRTGFAGLPARVTRDLALRQTIETEIDDVLGQCADLFERRAGAIEARRRADPAAEAAVAGRVGGEEPDLSAELG